ncbi:MAG TPA: OmpH family outer membrane protein [Planctomycetota bacterium]
MQRSLGLGISGILAVAICLVLPCSWSHAGQKEQRLAIVNVSMVFEKYDKVSDVQRQIDGKHTAKKDDLSKRGAELSRRNKDLEQNFSQQSQSEDVFDMVQRLRKDQFRFERDLNTLNAEIQRDYTREMRVVLTDIRVAIHATAEKGGFDMVLRSPDSDNPDAPEEAPNGPPNPAARDNKTYLETIAPQSVAELVERFNRNPVLFGAKTVDITQEVIKKLNDEYLKRSLGGASTKK